MCKYMYQFISVICCYIFNFVCIEQFKKYLEKAKRDNETEKLSLYKLVIFGPPRVRFLKSCLVKILKRIQKVQESVIG